MTRPDYAQWLRASLTDPKRVLEALALGDGARRQSSGYLILCPAHAERTASCSVRLGPDGTIAVKCFGGCELAGDVFTLIAAVRGLNLRSQFKDVLLEAAEIAGESEIADEIRGGPVDPNRVRQAPPAPKRLPEVQYVPTDDLTDLWRATGPVTRDAAAFNALASRGLEVAAIERFDLARVIAAPMQNIDRVHRRGSVGWLPWWASYKGDAPEARSWAETGHRILIRTFDAAGEFKSVRAWRIEGDGDLPKRLPPSAHRGTALVMANAVAVELLQKKRSTAKVVIAEGEPDWLTDSLLWSGCAVFGLLSGSWTREFAERIPAGSKVVIRTHRDAAGDQYAKQISDSGSKHWSIWRAA